MIYISIVSHGHYEIIKKLGALSNLTKNSFVKIIIKDNLGEK
ncbi:glycosyltransferase family 2 protein, partial [Salmonella enterica subsp. enterica serovar Fann]|nr:glycosyltransferase family 2 protein [Salmonella enterica subsp. enterica serovar Fann]